MADLLANEAAADTTAATTTETTAADTTNATETAAGGDKATETTTDAATTETASESDAAEADGEKAKSAWGDDWREQMAGGDEDIAKLLQRYGSPTGIAKALKESKDTIRSGKLKRDAPDPTDAKAMAEWRKEQGIPDDATGYKLPDPVAKRLTDEDKPVLAQFTEFAHSKNAPPAFVEMAAEWYVGNMEAAAEKRAADDAEAESAAEEALRKDWAAGEYKANMTLAKRFISDVPGVGEDWSEFRGPDGRRLGDNPEFVQWASDQARGRFGDAVFASGDSERKHTARKDEIKAIMDSDLDRYWREGLDKEYQQIIEREQKRRA